MRLKELRKKQNLTQTEFANIIGLQRATYNKQEIEKAKPDIDTLIKFADYYDVSLDYLVGRDNSRCIDKSKLTPNQSKLIDFVLKYDDYMNEKFLLVLYGYISRLDPSI